MLDTDLTLGVDREFGPVLTVEGLRDRGRSRGPLMRFTGLRVEARPRHGAFSVLVPGHRLAEQRASVDSCS